MASDEMRFFFLEYSNAYFFSLASSGQKRKKHGVHDTRHDLREGGGIY